MQSPEGLPTAPQIRLPSQVSLRDHGPTQDMLAWPPKVPGRSHCQPHQGKGSPHGVKPATLTTTTQALIPQVGLDQSQALKSVRKTTALTHLDPVPLPTVSHTLRAAQARVAVRKWRVSRGPELEAWARAQLACRAWIPRRTLIGCSAGRFLLSMLNILGGT